MYIVKYRIMEVSTEKPHISSPLLSSLPLCLSVSVPLWREECGVWRWWSEGRLGGGRVREVHGLHTRHPERERERDPREFRCTLEAKRAAARFRVYLRASIENSSRVEYSRR